MILEAIPAALAEFMGYVIGKVTGRVFQLEEKQAQRIGEYIILGVVAVAGMAITLIYS